MMQVYNSNHPQHGLFMPAPPSSTNTSPVCCSQDDHEDFHIRSKLFLAAMTTSLQRIAHEELLLSRQAQGHHSVVHVSTETTAAATSATTALSLISDQVHPKLLEVSRLRRRNQRSLLLQVQEQQQQQQQLEQPHSVTQTRRIFSRSDSTTPSTIVENHDDDDSSLSSYGSSD
jgi:hypothetical protein